VAGASGPTGRKTWQKRKAEVDTKPKADPKAKKTVVPRSRRLHEAGFTTLAQATACTEAVMADLEAGRIDATEANRITNAVGQWRRLHTRKGGR
jgi:hypothetical protein